MDNRYQQIHDAIHKVSDKTKDVYNAFKIWEEEVSKFYILCEDVCKERVQDVQGSTPRQGIGSDK